MIEKSLLNKKLIINIVMEKYGIKIVKSRKVNRGSANIYKLEDENLNVYILKEFQLKYKKENIDKEINIINFLSQKDIKVPKYIQLLNGEYSFINNEHVITLQKYINGYVLEKNKCNLEQTIESAEFLGKIVQELENLEHEYNFKPKSWFDTNFDDAIKNHKKIIENIKEDEYKEVILNDINEKISMLEEMKKINFTNLDKVTIKYTHGDYSVMQFIYLNGKINAIIDFVSASDMPIIWEIIRSYSYIYKKNKNGNFDIDGFLLYVKEYLKYTTLNKYDLEYMPYIYLIQLLKSTFGYKQYIESKNLDLLKFGIYRTNICRNLMKQSKNIAEILKENILI